MSEFDKILEQLKSAEKELAIRLKNRQENTPNKGIEAGLLSIRFAIEIFNPSPCTLFLGTQQIHSKDANEVKTSDVLKVMAKQALNNAQKIEGK